MRLDWLIIGGGIHGVHAAHVLVDGQGAAQGLARQTAGWRVETAQGALEARHVLLAIGRTQPHWPPWAAAGRALGLPIQHIFAPDYTLPQAALHTPHSTILVVGGGITAAQVSLQLAEQTPGAVTLLMRHPIREHQLDSDPGWLGPKYQNGLHKTADYAQRRQMIQAARHRGSMPPEVVRQVRRAQKAGQLWVREGEVTAVVPMLKNGRIELVCRGGRHIWAEQVVLATGFDPVRPGGAWLDEAIAANGLPVAPCGFPIVDKTLCWAPGLYVSGALAELEMGPIATNIAGARQAMRRLAAASVHASDRSSGVARRRSQAI